MTVTSTNNFTEYQADGIATTFAMNFLLLDKEDLQVYLNNQLVTSGYKLNGLGNPISEIVFDTAPTGHLLLQRSIKPTRETDYQENGDLLAKTVNRDFDRIYLLIQDLAQGKTQTIRVEDAQGINALPVSEYRADKILGFDSNGQATLIQITQGSAVDVLNQLADSSSNAKGSALVSHVSSLNYPAKTVGASLNTLLESISGDNARGFTYLYPNGGTAENPQTLTSSTRYELDNPFGDSERVICIPEAYINLQADYVIDGWCPIDWVTVVDVTTTPSSPSVLYEGIKAGLFNNKIVIQTGRGLLSVSNISGVLNDFTGTRKLGFNSAGIRIKVFKL